jgi:serine/threonine-protein kinase
VIALVAALVLVAVAVAWLLGPGEENGDGPGNGNAGAGAPIAAGPVQDFDPHGDDVEHTDQIALATDGITTTAWTTENYSTTLQAQKEGVGLLFDLQEEVEVGEIEITASPRMAFEVRAGTEAGTTETDFTTVADEQRAATGVTRVELGPDAGRYWLIWITEFPTGSGSGAIFEVRFLEP